jgi:hypothetical protein
LVILYGKDSEEEVGVGLTVEVGGRGENEVGLLGGLGAPDEVGRERSEVSFVERAIR